MSDEQLTVVTFLWTPAPGYRSKFEGRHVDVLRRMVRRHYPRPHRFVCVTDNPRGITEPDVELFELWPDYGTLRNPSGSHNPSCYRRLRLFAGNTGDWLGPRFVCLDLDCVLTADMRPLWDRIEDFVIWRSTTSGNPYNGSMFMLRAGTRERVWMDFDGAESPAATRAAGMFGSDQAWIAHCLGPNEAVWTAADGVLSWRNQVAPRGGILPAGARAVFFHGRFDPWDHELYRRHAWIRENWR